MKTSRRVRLVAVSLLAGLLTASFAIAQKDDQAEVVLQAARQKQLVDGDLEAAIQLYKNILANYSGNRAVAAKALLEMGRCYEKLGNTEARKAYERVLREYADQPEAATEARKRLAMLLGNGATRTSEMVTRRVWAGPDVDVLGSPSPDGRYLSYVDWTTGDLALRDLATGKTRRLTKNDSGTGFPGSALLSVISPDGKEAAYAWLNKDDSCDLRVVGLDGSAPRILYSNKEVQIAVPDDWSPDGKSILAFLFRKDERNQIALVSVADGSVRVLKTLDPRLPGNIKFSPDGRYIAYDFPQQQDSDNRDIFLLAADGSREIRLVEHPADDLLLGWAPDGNHILFASDRSGSMSAWALRVADGKPQGSPELVKQDIGQGHPMGFTRAGSYYYGLAIGTSDVYTAEFDPAAGRVLTQPQKAIQRFVGSNSSPAWSPDGQYLAYMSQRRVEVIGPGEQVLSIRSLKTGQERDFSPKLFYIEGNIRWSPDGRSILVASKYRKNFFQKTLSLIDVQTGQVRPILQTEPGSGWPDPAWFPDGKRLLYRNLESGTTNETILMRDLETGREKELFRAASGEIRGIALSPDGRQLALTLRDWKTQSTILKVLSVTAGEARELLTVKKPETVVGDSLTWSPDSRYIVFARGRRTSQGPKTELFAVSPGDGEPHALGLAMDFISSVSFQPDGHHLAFAAGMDKSEVWVMENFLPTLKAAK